MKQPEEVIFVYPDDSIAVHCGIPDVELRPELLGTMWRGLKRGRLYDAETGEAKRVLKQYRIPKDRTAEDHRKAGRSGKPNDAESNLYYTRESGKILLIAVKQPHEKEKPKKHKRKTRPSNK